MDNNLGRMIAGAAIVVGCTACFPTYQSARAEPGLNFHVEGMVLSGHHVSHDVHGPDYMATVTGAYGFGRRFEIGVPLGVYLTGFGSTYPVLMPYAKLALGDPEKDREHLALFAQASGALGAVFSSDRGSWEPNAMVSRLSSAGGQHGDFAFNSRYAQDNQSLWVAATGVTLRTPERPAIEVGFLRNRYTDGNAPHIINDVFVRLKIGMP